MLQRRVSIRGPRFYQEDGQLMFINVIDHSTWDGPRPATEHDMVEFAEALANQDHVEPLKPLLQVRDPEGDEAA